MMVTFSLEALDFKKKSLQLKLPFKSRGPNAVTFY